MTEKERPDLEEIIKREDIEKNTPSDDLIKEQERYNQTIRDTQPPPEHDPDGKQK